MQSAQMFAERSIFSYWIQSVIWKESPPARGRGLKQCGLPDSPLDRESPPARGRGLKLEGKCHEGKLLDVAPRAGAWIET